MLMFVSNPKPAESSGSLPFSDNFNDGIADGWTEHLGTWSVVNGEYFVSVGMVENGISTVNELNLTDCIIETKLRFADTEVGFRAGIVFRYFDNENYYAFELSNEYDCLQLDTYCPGHSDYGVHIVAIVPGGYPIQPDTNYLLKVVVQGGTFRCFVNNQEVLSGIDGNYTSGKVGLRARRAHAFFDDFKVLSIPKTITVPDDYATIQEAINRANEGDTVFVRNGTYCENVVANKTISLVGEKGAVIDGNYAGTVVKIASNNVTVTGLTIVKSHNLKYGIDMSYTNSCIIRNNTIANNEEGIHLEYSWFNSVVQNVLVENERAIFLQASPYTNVSKNIIENNNVGITCFGSGSDICWISGNIITWNHLGIFLHWCDGKLIIGNDITNNGCGISEIEASCNTIFHNNIVNNSIQAYGVTLARNYWDNSCEGNYWSDYNGTDSDGDGIGDIPYMVGLSNQDNYPLMNPYWNPSDINHDLKVDLKDVYKTALAYGSYPSHPKWNPHCDINEDATVDLKDYYTVCRNFGEEYSLG